MRRRGFTIAEVMVAAMLFAILMVTSVALMDFISRTGLRVRARSEPRQQIRSLMQNLSQDFRAASYLWTSWSGNLLGQTVTVPNDSLLFAIPQDDTANPEYVVTLVTFRPRSQVDPNNKNVKEAVYHRFQPDRPPAPLTPGGLNPLALRPGTQKVFDCYATNYSFALAPSRDGVEFKVTFVQAPQRGQVQTETFHTFLTMRNNL